MVGIGFWELFIWLVMIGFFVIPVFMAVFSSKAKGRKKFIWYLLSNLFGLVGYLSYRSAATKDYRESQLSMSN